MNQERKEEAAALYALDLLEGEERLAFEREMAADPALRTQVEQLRTASTSLAHALAPQTPSPALKTRIFASIGEKPATPESRPSAAPVSFWAWTGWAAAACLALSSFFLYRQAETERAASAAQAAAAEEARRALDSLKSTFEAERTALSTELAQLRQAGDIAQLKIARLALLSGNSPEAVAIAVWNPLKQEGVLTVDSLPLIQQDQDYQLWLIDPQQAAPVSAGIFAIDERGNARVQFKPNTPVTAAQFAISRERKGGSETPQGAIIAAGAL